MTKNNERTYQGALPKTIEKYRHMIDFVSDERANGNSFYIYLKEEFYSPEMEGNCIAEMYVKDLNRLLANVVEVEKDQEEQEVEVVEEEVVEEQEVKVVEEQEVKVVVNKQKKANGHVQINGLNKVYALENGIYLMSEQVQDKIVSIPVDEKGFGAIIDKQGRYIGRTTFYSDNKNAINSDNKATRDKARKELVRIELVKSDRYTMNVLYNSLEDKNDIAITMNFYNYINKVIHSANNKMLRYRSETLSASELVDIRQFFFVDLIGSMQELPLVLDDGVKSVKESYKEEETIEAKFDFNYFNSMEELNFILHKIATSEINKRMYKLHRDVSIDEELDKIFINDKTSKIMNEIELALHDDDIELQQTSERVARIKTLIDTVASPKQKENFERVVAKKQYENSTTYEERQRMSEEEKLQTYKLTSTERSHYRHLVNKVIERLD